MSRFQDLKISRVQDFQDEDLKYEVEEVQVIKSADIMESRSS